MEKPARPAWAHGYLRFAAWTQDEFRNLLCGIPPRPPEDAPIQTREQINADYVRNELRRVDADRHIQDAVLTGQLKVLEPTDQRLLEKVTPHLDSAELEALRRALAHHHACEKAFRVSRDAAIKWATFRRDLFPAFPFSLDDLNFSSDLGPDGPAQDSLKEHRQRLVKKALAARGFATKKAFYGEHKDLTSDVLRGVINSDHRRTNLEFWTPKVLEALGLTQEEWDAK